MGNIILAATVPINVHRCKYENIFRQGDIYEDRMPLPYIPG